MELKPEPVGICYLVHAVPENILNLRVKADHGTTIEWIQRPISGFCLHMPLHLLQQWQARFYYKEIKVIFGTVCLAPQHWLIMFPRKFAYTVGAFKTLLGYSFQILQQQKRKMLN